MSMVWQIIEIVGYISLGLGSLGVIFGALGLLRLGDIYQRMHGSGIVDTGGAGLILFGLLLLSPDWTVSVRLILIGFILVMTSPTATHAIARAARVSGVDGKLSRKLKPKPKVKPKPKTKGAK
ncbi:MAG: monovalent cation/H(+) antiporter subunit G [Rhodobiaceae bacterium]|jgi:multicomponent Na+:H+ antiporter subunit G|nr:monovalent cation/H(+) antiporter subunit G [Rhodobiaceae bacterium]